MIARFAAAIRALRYAGTVAAENLVLRREVEQALCALGREHLDAPGTTGVRRSMDQEQEKPEERDGPATPRDGGRGPGWVEYAGRVEREQERELREGTPPPAN